MHKQLETEKLSKSLKNTVNTFSSTLELENHIASVCNHILRTAAKNSKNFDCLKHKQDEQKNALITTALASLYGLALLSQASQKQQQGNTQIHQRHRFYHDQKNAAVVLVGDFKITGSNYKIIAELLENFHEGKRSGNEIACIAAVKLAKMLNISESSLRINLCRLRILLKQHFKSMGINLDINDFIENCKWKGYRINKNLIEVMALMDLEG